MDQPEGARILPGMTGSARGRVRQPGVEFMQGIEIPLSALVSTDGETSYVWIVDETTGVVAQHDVGVGELTDRGVLVTGLEPGTWIATAGVHYLREGQRVRIAGVAPIAGEEDAS